MGAFIAEKSSSGEFDHVIMAGDQFGEPVQRVAIQYPTMRFTVIDYAFMPPVQNVEGIIFRDDQVGYLAGVVACEVAQDSTGGLAAPHVAVVAGAEPMDTATKKRVN